MEKELSEILHDGINRSELRKIGLLLMFTDNDGSLIYDGLTQDDQNLISDGIVAINLNAEQRRYLKDLTRKEIPENSRLVTYRIDENHVIPFALHPWEEPEQVQSQTMRESAFIGAALGESPKFLSRQLQDMRIILHIDSDNNTQAIRPHGTEYYDFHANLIRGLGGNSGGNAVGGIASDYDIHDGSYFSSSNMNPNTGDVYMKMNDPKIIAKLREPSVIALQPSHISALENNGQ